MECSNLARAKPPCTECYHEQLLAIAFRSGVKCAYVFGDKPWIIGLVGIPVELLVEASGRIDASAFAPDQMGVPVVDDVVDAAFGLSTVEFVVELIEGGPAAVDSFVRWSVTIASD